MSSVTQMYEGRNREETITSNWFFSISRPTHCQSQRRGIKENYDKANNGTCIWCSWTKEGLSWKVTCRTKSNRIVLEHEVRRYSEDCWTHLC